MYYRWYPTIVFILTDLIKYKQAEKLRKQGKSYTEISFKTGITKSTLSNWFSKKSWSNEVKSNLNNSRLKTAKKNLTAANLARIKIQRERREHYTKEAQLEFKELTKDPLFLVGLGIYWGEGDKTNNGRVAVINTDPELLLIVTNFYRRCLGISNNNLRIGLFIYEDINQETAIKFWSEKLKIPRSQFIKIQILKSRSQLTKNKSKYGICSLYFSNTKFNVKIHEWIRLLGIHKFAGIV